MIEFTKMHGIGNDYIYVNADFFDIPDPSAAAIKWSRPHTGIGADGLVLISRSDVADFRMRMFNADGSEGRMCGNASRCIAKYVYEKGLCDKTVIKLETLAGIKTLFLDVVDGEVKAVTVDMGTPLLSSTEQVATPDGTLEDRAFEINSEKYSPIFVSMGNPHAVFFVPQASEELARRCGPAIENDTVFPERTNVEFVQVLDDGSLKMVVWERGSGITMACGTGACAAAVAACLVRERKSYTVRMQGGDLRIEWAGDGHVYMTGPAEFVFEGIVEL